MPEVKMKNRQYSADYIIYGFIESPKDPSTCFICQETFSNDAKKPLDYTIVLIKCTLIKKTKVWHIFKTWKIIT